MADYLYGDYRYSKAHLVVEGNLSFCGKELPKKVTADDPTAAICQVCTRMQEEGRRPHSRPTKKVRAQCHRIGCGRDATGTHVRMDVPVCDYHRRAPTNSYTTKRPSDGRTSTHGGFISRQATQGHMLSRPRWEGMAEGENGPVKVVKPVKWCATCKKPIEARYTYCLDCFRALSNGDKARTVWNQRNTRRQRWREERRKKGVKA